MTTFVIASLLVVGDARADQRAATALARDVAQVIGATVHKLAVVADDTVSGAERTALVEALARTELFTLVNVAEASAVVTVRRVGPASILATVADASGERLWVGRAPWPAESEVVAVAPAGESATPEETHLKTLQYQRERLWIARLVRTYSAIPFVLGDDPERLLYWDDVRASYHETRWGHAQPYGGEAVMSRDWGIVRGSTQIIDELDLAEYLDDEHLVGRIETARFWPRLVWVTGFGLGAAAGLTTGAFLAQSDADDTRNVGISLVFLGAVSGVLALLYPTVGAKHVLDPSEAAVLCEEHNERLRRNLGLTPEEARRAVEPDR